MQALSALARASAVDTFREAMEGQFCCTALTQQPSFELPHLGHRKFNHFRSFDAQRMKDSLIPARSVVGTGTCQMDI